MKYDFDFEDKDDDNDGEDSHDGDFSIISFGEGAASEVPGPRTRFTPSLLLQK